MAWENRTPPDSVRRPRYDIWAYPGPATPADNRVPQGGLHLTSVVERIRTTKNLSTPMGTFEITCTYQEVPGMPGLPVSQVLIPGNVIDIWLDTGLPETTLEVVMRGYVALVEQSETLDGRGRPIRSIQVGGFDCGGWFMKHMQPIWMYSNFSHSDPEAEARFKAGIYIGGTLGQVLRQVFLAIFTQVAPLQTVIEDGQLITEPLLDNQDDGTADYWPAFLPYSSLDAFNGQFWSAYRQFDDHPWVETFGDYIASPATSHYANYLMADPKLINGGVPDAAKNAAQNPVSASVGGAGYYLISRRQPFSIERWNALPKTTIYDSEVKLARTRQDDAERCNVVFVNPGTAGFESTNAFPIYGTDARYVHRDEDSMKRYGTCMRTFSSIYAAFAANDPKDPKVQKDVAAGQGETADAIAKRADALWRWFSINHKLASGLIITAGMPSIRIGEKIVGQGSDPASAYLVSGGTGFGAEQIRREWYVTQVVQEYVDGANYLTNIAVTRGQPPDSFITAATDVLLSNLSFTGIDWTNVSDWHPPMKLPGT